MDARIGRRLHDLLLFCYQIRTPISFFEFKGAEKLFFVGVLALLLSLSDSDAASTLSQLVVLALRTCADEAAGYLPHYKICMVFGMPSADTAVRMPPKRAPMAHLHLRIR